MALIRLLALLVAVAAAAGSLVSAPAWGDQQSGLLVYREDQQQAPTRLSLPIPSAHRREESSLPDHVAVFRKDRGDEAATALGEPRPWWMAPQVVTSEDFQRLAPQRTADLSSQFLQLLMQEVKRVQGKAENGRLAGEDPGLTRGVVRPSEQRSGDPQLAAMPPVPIAFRSFINSPDIPTLCPDGTKVAHDKSCRSVWKRASS
ncbi:uncharacterized protein LOC126323150 [Schistocerca gregaria]|uniref:uncharacterized protein LOC126323150 n=1 Tax=Schistocerca gregaria TaxID=7010 RepID=UPI00211DF545|nr:uncharacterized protein LOC126323150 [Schistocerca gregaria]